MSLMEFADALNPEDMTAWATQMQQNTVDDAEGLEKKS